MLYLLFIIKATVQPKRSFCLVLLSHYCSIASLFVPTLGN